MTMQTTSRAAYHIGLNYRGTVQPHNRVMLDYTGPAYVNWYICSGSVTVKEGYETFGAGPGDWVFFDPIRPRSHWFSEALELISIRFSASLGGLPYIPPLQPARRFPGSRQPALAEAAASLVAVEAQAAEAITTAATTDATDRDTPDLAMECRRSAALHTFLAEWHHNREAISPTTFAHLDDRVFAIMRCLENCRAAGPVDYAAIGKAAGLSRAQANRVFKNGTGMTPRQWIDTRALREAQSLVGASSKSFKEIAHDLGFRDASHFSRWFREKSGATPKAWRFERPV